MTGAQNYSLCSIPWLHEQNLGICQCTHPYNQPQGCCSCPNPSSFPAGSLGPTFHLAGTPHALSLLAASLGPTSKLAATSEMEHTSGMAPYSFYTGMWCIDCLFSQKAIFRKGVMGGRRPKDVGSNRVGSCAMVPQDGEALTDPGKAVYELERCCSAGLPMPPRSSPPRGSV